MSVQAMTWVMESERRTKGGDRLVLMSIANHADRFGDNSWPSIITIATESNLSERATQYALERLIKARLIEVEQQAGGRRDLRNDRRPNRYRIVAMSRGEAGCTPLVVNEAVDNSIDKLPRGEIRDSTGCKIQRHGVKPVAPDPSLTVLEPSEEEECAKTARAVDKKKRKSGIPEQIAAAADSIYQSDPQRFLHLVKWIRQKLSEKYPEPLIIAALEEFRTRLATITGEWWPYLETIAKHRRSEYFQAESEKHKGKILGLFGQALRSLVKDI